MGGVGQGGETDCGAEMTEQPDLFDHAPNPRKRRPNKRERSAREARDDGMQTVDENADEEWRRVMSELVVKVAKQRRTFTSDDVFDLLDALPRKPVTHDLRAFGPVMMRAIKDGVCRKADRASIPSRRASLHASPRTVWESLICAL